MYIQTKNNQKRFSSELWTISKTTEWVHKESWAEEISSEGKFISWERGKKYFQTKD